MKTKNTDRGCVAWNDYALGIGIEGRYTQQEIFDIGVSLRPKQISDSVIVEPRDDAKDYVWIPWNRFGMVACSRACVRTQHPTKMDAFDDLCWNYVGSGKPYREAWDKYIPVSERMSVLRKLTLGYVPRLLDVGCGAGNQLLVYAAHGFDVYGMESDAEMFSDRHHLLKMDNRIVHGDALNDTYVFTAGSFSVVVCSVLLNIWSVDVPGFMLRMRNLVCNGGWVIFDTLPHKHTKCEHSRSTIQRWMVEAGLTAKAKTPTMLIGQRRDT